MRYSCMEQAFPGLRHYLVNTLHLFGQAHKFLRPPGVFPVRLYLLGDPGIFYIPGVSASRKARREDPGGPVSLVKTLSYCFFRFHLTGCS